MHLQSLSRDEISSPQNSLDFVLVCKLYKLTYSQQMSFFSSLLFIFLIFTNRFIQYICPPLCLQKNKVVQVCFLSFRIILLFQLVLLMLSPISKTQDGEKSDSSTWTSARDALNIALIQSKISIRNTCLAVVSLIRTKAVPLMTPTITGINPIIMITVIKVTFSFFKQNSFF